MQLERNHLKPIGNVFHRNYARYYLKLTNILVSDVYTELSLLEVPAFDFKNILYVERKKGIENYKIVYRIAKEVVFPSKDEEIEIIQHERRLSPYSYKILERLFETALKQTRYPEKEPIILDGVDHYFSNQLKTGRISSPDNNSLIGMLVSVCDRIKNLVASSNRPLDFDDDLKAEIEKLIQNINSDH